MINKEEVINFLENLNGNYSDLYKKSIYLDVPNDGFNYEDYNGLLYRNMYTYHRLYGIENIIPSDYRKRFNLPFNIDKDVDYLQFMIYLNTLDSFEFKSDILPNIKTVKDNIIRLAAQGLLGMGDWSWTKVYSDVITKVKTKEDGKMYLSVDNKDLYLFAILLQQKCLEKDLFNYSFKINNNEYKTRRDNVVIYFNDSNYNKYLEIINEIILEYPEIQFNEQNLFAVSVTPYVKVACDTVEYESFTGNLCEIMEELLAAGVSINRVVDVVEEEVVKVIRNIEHIIYKDKIILK